MEDKIIFSCPTLELSEFKTYIELKSMLCWYGYPNLNGALLPVDAAEEKAKTLVNQPVVAFYKKDAFGRDDLGGHEATKDINGNMHFGTENIGVNTAVEVKETTVEINGQSVTTPCLYATRRVWTRNQNVVNAIKRLFEEKKLTSSWEVIVNSYTFQDGIKTLDDYTFVADALLGSQVTPAFSCAKTLSVASTEENELLIAEALANDINLNKEDKHLDGKNINPTVTESPAQPEPQTASLTERDLRKKVQKACQDKISKWCWIAYHFPLEKKIWVEYEERASELDYYEFTYDVGEGEVITVSDPIEVKLTVSIAEINNALATKDTEISEKEKTISTKDTEISTRDESLIKANSRIKELEEEVVTLNPFKEAYEKAEKERIEAENAQKRVGLTELINKSKLFTKDELASEELASLVEKLDEAAIKNKIADRFMASLDKHDKKPEHETSSTKDNKKTNIDSDEFDNSSFTIAEFIRIREKNKN